MQRGRPEARRRPGRAQPDRILLPPLKDSRDNVALEAPGYRFQVPNRRLREPCELSRGAHVPSSAAEGLAHVRGRGADEPLLDHGHFE